MTQDEFRKLCEETPTGTTLSFSYRDLEIHGKFIGCTDNDVVIEANGRHYLWPKELCQYRPSDYPPPSYS